jgi:Holliday junction resolvase RusA-like endonuclease
MTDHTAHLSVAGEPRAKARPRVTRHGTYTPKITRDYESLIRAAWDAEPRPDAPACVRLDVTFYLGTHRRVDVDNLAKSAADALLGRAYDDDWRVHEMRVRKFYTSRDRARTEIRVYAIDPDREEAS